VWNVVCRPEDELGLTVFENGLPSMGIAKGEVGKSHFLSPSPLGFKRKIKLTKRRKYTEYL
jgi:hypothetical protein